MNFIARLMSHGFAIALVLLLAIGFMYRGELFPEWKLPEFLALDSAKAPAGDQPAARIEPAPIRHDAMEQATATGGQAAAEKKAGAAAVTDSVPPVAGASAPAAAVMAAREPVDADATAMGKPSVAEAALEREPAGADEPAASETAAAVSTPPAYDAGAAGTGKPTVAEAVASSEPAGADEPVESETAAAAVGSEPAATVAAEIAQVKPAAADAADYVEQTRAGMPAPVTTAAAPAPAAIAPPPAAVPAVVETVDLPATGRVQASAGQAAVSTGAREATRALLEKTGAGHTAKVTEAATDAMPGVAPATAIPDIGASSESLRGTFAKAAAPVPAATGAATARPAAEMPAMAAIAPAAPGMATDAPAGSGFIRSPMSTHTGAPDSGLLPTPMTAAEDAVATGVMPAPAGPGTHGPVAATPAAPALSSYQLLALAREAYWMREYQAAGEFYREMILQDPDNPDGYGELANMYFSQGDWEAAASAYYEAGSRLVKSGLLASARELVDVIRGLEGPQADALAHEIETAQSESQ